MKYMDEELLDARRKLEYQKHTTLETGIYAGENLITFTLTKLPNSTVSIPLPDQFIIMPDSVKDVKYPSKMAPAFILTSLDSTINICFNILPVVLKDEEIQDMSNQFQNSLKNINRTLTIKNETTTQTTQGNKMSWFEYKGYHLDGQSYNRVYLIRLRKNVLHGIFNCDIKDSNCWIEIIDKIFLAIEEEV